MNYETEELNKDERNKLPGSFIKLTHGYTHYELQGPNDGKIIVLVHGFSAPYIVWNNIYHELVTEGFLVLRYDLYGRGYSDRPELKYNFDLFDQQLYELLNKLQLNHDKVHLVGLSMGGGIVMTFADRHPTLVQKVTLIDPIGFSLGFRFDLLLLKIPLINKLLLKFVVTHKKIIAGQKPDFHDFPRINDYLEEFVSQMKYKGFLQAIHSTILNLPFTGLEETYKRVANRSIPIQLFWGEKDKTIPFKTSKKVLKTVPSIEFHPISGSGHQPQYTHPEEVLPLLVSFIQKT
ncbi:MAG: alpha/beta fold hydrolase [Candidatus Hodarchaeales archaeon]